MVTKKTIVLAIVVAAVWGTIALKIFQGIGNEDIPQREFGVREITSSIADSKEDYPLALNYSDPFSKKNRSEASNMIRKKKISPKPQTGAIRETPHVIIQWNKIEYLGSMYNASRKSHIATLRIDGVEYIGKQGDKVNEFAIEKILTDSLLLSFGVEKKYITKKQ